MTGIIGHSGAGKQLFKRILSGLFHMKAIFWIEGKELREVLAQENKAIIEEFNIYSKIVYYLLIRIKRY